VKLSAVKKIAVLLLNTGLTKVLGLLTHFILASFLSKEEFGIYAIVVVVLSIFGALKNGGAHQYLMHHCDKLKTIESDVYYFSLLANSCLMLVLISFSKTIADFYQASILEDLLYLVAVSITLSTPWVVYRVELLVNNKYDLVSKIRLTVDFIKYSSTIALVYLGCGLVSMVIPLVIEGVLLTLIGWRVAGAWIGIGNFNGKIFRAILTDTKWIMLAAIAIALTKQGDYFSLSLYVNKEDLGIYYFSYQLVFSVVVFFITLSEFVIVPLFAKKKAKEKEVSELFLTILTGSTIVGIAISSLLYFFIGDVIHYLWGGKWDESIQLLEIMVFLIIFLNIYYVSRAVCDALGLWKVRVVLNSVYGVGIVFVSAFSAVMGDIYFVTINVFCFHVFYSIIQLFIVARIVGGDVKNIFNTLVSLLIPFAFSVIVLYLVDIYYFNLKVYILFPILFFTYSFIYFMECKLFFKQNNISRQRLFMLVKAMS